MGKIKKCTRQTIDDILYLLDSYTNSIHKEFECLENIQEKKINQEIVECVICMGEINVNFKICTGCKGCYHRKCIIKWTQDKNKKSCPKCRRSINSTMNLCPDEKYLTFTQIIKYFTNNC